MKTTVVNGKMPEGFKAAFDLIAAKTLKDIEDYAKWNPTFECRCDKMQYCGTGCKNHSK